VVVLAGVAAGCGSSATSESMTPSTRPMPTMTTQGANDATTLAQPARDTITIKNFAFGAPITVKPGATVTVKNVGVETHTLSADDAMFDTGNIFGGKTVTFVAPMMPGSYAFHCNFHNMHGTLIVSA